MSPEQDRARREWFKLLACDSHTWPSQTCDRCYARVFERLESLMRVETRPPKARPPAPEVTWGSVGD